MSRQLFCALVIISLWSSVVTPVVGRELENGKVNSSQGDRVPGVLVLHLAQGVMPSGDKNQGNGATMGHFALDSLNTKYGLSDYYPLFPRGKNTKGGPRAESEMDRWHLLYFGPNVDLDKLAAEYAALPDVALVEFDYYVYIMRTPNDAQYSLMYQLNQGSDRDMDAPEAWDITVGSPTVVLADTDTGVLYTHEDLQGNIWVNPGEDLDQDGAVMDPSDMDGVDSDTNGYIDDLIGWDFVAGGTAVWPGEDGSIEDNDPKDFNGHGTHTSGTIAAVTNNALGVSGVAGGFGPTEPGCKIMCLRMGWSFNDNGSENGQTFMSYVAKAFTYAYRNGATAINYSFGSSGGGGIEDATDSAAAQGLVICASAGNDNNSSFGYLQTREDVLCVASTNSSDVKSSFSNYGFAVDVSAPGSSIRSTVSNHYSPSYAIYSGTSMAAPQVVGQVGLIRSLNPILTREEVFDVIINTSEDIDALNPAYAGQLGSGRINLNSSVQNLASTNFSADPLVGQAPLTVQFYDSSLTTPTAWIWYFGDGDSSLEQNPIHTFAPGLYDVTLRTETAIGNGQKIKTNFIASMAESLSTSNAVGVAYDTVVVDVWADNYQEVREIILPIRASNIPGSASFDSITTSGCLTEYFESKQTVYDNRPTGAICLRLRADNNGDGLPGPLPQASGPIARLWFTLNSGVDPANAIVIDTATLSPNQYQLKYFSPVFEYVPVYQAGTISILVLPGDINFDGVHDIIDVVKEVDHIFRGVPLPAPADRVDASCDGAFDVLDVIKVIEYAFRGVAAAFCP